MPRLRVQVVAVSDSEHVKGEAIAERFKCPLYSSSYELLEREEVDFARHASPGRSGPKANCIVDYIEWFYKASTLHKHQAKQTAPAALLCFLNRERYSHRASLAPTGICARRRSNVGASLLATATTRVDANPLHSLQH